MVIAMKQRGGRGFSLVELMMTLAVMAVLLVVAVPSLRDAVRRHKVTAAANALLADLAYARSEAILGGIVVSVCTSSRDRKKCDQTNAYEPGWLVHLGLAGTDGAIPAMRTRGLPLRFGPPRDGVAIQGLDRSLSFDAMGQLHASIKKPPKFTVCFRSSASGPGTSTAAVPGVEFTVNASGRVTTRGLGAGEACLS
ncbi:GspH/FimT family pseudopilin [Dyella marensis]|uniref:Type II secretion system protein H n=1 Tax=Dyella marensis TaxID=500610 RepID=A0A1I2D8V6_9GAMM|nr:MULTISPECIES: GspH/FimT family pseudopilin [Dyella]SFE76543.1 type IV fimbrial biogenesis protein FimT [Dyella marensis]